MSRAWHFPPALAVFALLASCAVLLGACRDKEGASPIGQAAGPPGLSEGSIASGGRQRTYRLYVPASLDPRRPAPLVVALHGGLGTPAQFAANSSFDAAAEAHAFIVVYPAGVGRTWNGGACCGQAARQSVDDVAFIAALIDHLSARYRIDPNRVFATGHSNGGIMAFRLACELADRVAAVAPVAASLEVDSCSPSRPVAVLAIHGDADLNHPLEGGAGPNSIAGVPFNSLAASMESLRRANGCSATPEVRREGAITTTTWKNCREGGHTEQKVIAGASHAWPGGDPRTAGPGGTPSPVLDATTAIWAFFAEHGR
ncbi:MAG TPA: PHB depolymerase family esterase [Dehalococcoidia bacterium]|nr:PHB depolymerase family esterase [Dehalococcoidia bacterium]